jgi:flagellar biosynthesis/type III secretory pathway M-ring protein FliF/YscJ
MLTAVIAITIGGIVMLAIALFTGNTIVAFVAIALAAIGLLLLARDWRRQRRRPDPGKATAANDEQAAPEKRVPDPETFQPDPWDEEATEDGAEEDFPEEEDSAG